MTRPECGRDCCRYLGDHRNSVARARRRPVRACLADSSTRLMSAVTRVELSFVLEGRAGDRGRTEIAEFLRNLRLRSLQSHRNRPSSRSRHFVASAKAATRRRLTSAIALPMPWPKRRSCLSCSREATSRRPISSRPSRPKLYRTDLTAPLRCSPAISSAENPQSRRIASVCSPTRAGGRCTRVGVPRKRGAGPAGRCRRSRQSSRDGGCAGGRAPPTCAIPARSRCRSAP